MSKKFRICHRFQLFNAFHKNDVFKILNDASVLDFEDTDNQNFSTLDQNDDENFDGNDIAEDVLPDSANEVTDIETKGLFCKTCEITFVNVTEQRQHFRLDWHRYNLKRKSHSQKPVDEEQFDEMMGETFYY
jgi:hypothetical protein